MSLLEEFTENCMLVDKIRTPDGEGGFMTSWIDSVPIRAAIVRDNSTLAKIAEKEGVTSGYTITTSRNVKLEFHDVIHRLSNDLYYRVTSPSGEWMSPKSSTLDINQVSAELWEVTR